MITIEDLKEEIKLLKKTIEHHETIINFQEQKIKNLEETMEWIVIQNNIKNDEKYKNTKKQQEQSESEDKISSKEETQKDINIIMNEIQKILDESLGFYVQLQTTTSEMTKVLLLENIKLNDKKIRDNYKKIVNESDLRKIDRLLQESNTILQVSKKVSGLK